MAVQAQRSKSHAAARRWRPSRVRVIQLSLVATILTLWELVGRQVGAFILAPPSAVAAAAITMVQSGELLLALQNSLLGLLIGYTIAIIIGVSVGGLMGWYPRFALIVSPFISAIYVIPIAALVPLLIVWLGIGALPRIVTIVLFSVFEILIATATGVREVDGRLIEMARTFGAQQRQLFRKIVFFDALPVVSAGLRIGAGRAVKGMVVAELLFAVSGLGGLVLRHANYFRTAHMMVVVLVVALLGITLVALMQWIERRMAPWYHREQ
jgi:ABC-type nitrate/sulfonate/bicarbonate transport system permease component